MAVYRVQGPDGAIHRFEGPDNATPEQVTAFAEQQFGKGKAGQYSVPVDSTAGKIISTLDKVESTPYIGPVVKGIRDVTKGGAQLLAHGINAVAPSILSDEELKNVDNDVRVSEQNYQAARKAKGAGGVDWGRLAGNIIVTAPAGGGGAATVPGAIAKGSLTGAAMGAMNPVVNEGDFASEKAKQLLLGSVGGGVGAGIVSGLSRVIQPKTNPNVKALIDQGVTPTPGQIVGGGIGRFEEKLTSVPVVGDAIKGAQTRALDQFNRAAYNRALEPIGKSAGPEIGREGVAGVKAALSEAYDDLLPKLQFKADGQFAQDLNKLTSMAQTLPPEQANRFQSILKNQLIGRMTPQGNMSGESMKVAESELSRLARGYKGDASADNRDLGNAIAEVVASMRTTLQRSNPDQAELLSKINQGFANYARIRDASGRIGANEGVFTPAQLQSAVRSADKSVGKGQFATGNALLQDLSEAGKSVLSSKYPDSGTAGRLMAGPGIGAAVGATNPLLVLGLGAAALPYSSFGQNVLAKLLVQRPAIAAPIANGMNRLAPVIGSATAGGLLGVYGPSAP